MTNYLRRLKLLALPLAITLACFASGVFVGRSSASHTPQKVLLLDQARPSQGCPISQQDPPDRDHTWCRSNCGPWFAAREDGVCYAADGQ